MGGGVSVESDPRMVNLRQSTKEEIQKYIQSIQSSSASSSSSSRPPNEDDKVEIDIDDEIKRILRLFRQGDKESSNSNTVNTSPPKTTAESEVVASSSIVKKKTVEEGKESSSMAVIAPLRKSRRRSISFTASSLNTRNLRPLTASTAAASSSGTSSSSRAIAEGTRRKMNEYSKNYLSATKSSASKLGINPNQLLLADRMRPNGLLLSSLSASTAQEEHDGEQSIEQAADMQSLDGYGRQDLNMTLIEEAFEEQKDVWSSPKMLNFSSDLSQSNDGSSIVDTTSSQFRRNSPYCCEICKIRFTSETLLQKHIQFSDKHKWGLEERHKLLLIAQRADKVF